jgi:hypothetical protein
MVYIFGRNFEYYKMACDDKRHDATFIDIPRCMSFRKTKKIIQSVYRKSSAKDIFVFYHTCFFYCKKGKEFGGIGTHLFTKKIKKLLSKIKNKKVLYIHDAE